MVQLDDDGQVVISDQLQDNWATDDDQVFINTVKQHRVWFTYLLTLSQIIICTLQITGTPVVPGSRAGWGLGLSTQISQVPLLAGNATLTIQRGDNPYYGPTTTRMVQWGAKYAPCMRSSPEMKDRMDAIKSREDAYGCCEVGGECGRMNSSYCAGYYGSRFWGEGSMCNSSCSLVLSPCCYGVTYECTEARKGFCDELDGHYHAGQQSCSEVNCLNGVCGLGADAAPGEFPSQPERFFLPIMLHAGVIHCAMNMLVQWQLGSELERVAGWWRFALMYFGAGIGGNLFAAVFVPDQISVGASSAIYGLFGVDYMLLFHAWKITQNKWGALCCSTFSLVLYLGIGTLPWIDNWAHCGGFCAGLLLANILLPRFSWAGWKRDCGLLSSVLALLIAFATGLSYFYSNKDPEFCSWCHYISCIPYTDGLCDSPETS